MIHVMVVIGKGILASSSTNTTTASPKAPDNGGIPGIAVRTVYVVSETCG